MLLNSPFKNCISAAIEPDTNGLLLFGSTCIFAQSLPCLNHLASRLTSLFVHSLWSVEEGKIKESVSPRDHPLSSVHPSYVIHMSQASLGLAELDQRIQTRR
ncbi:hypothetical protein AVEN_210663-1 [Araneus ventricosus]|uniref:Uncharacterized protein n=1 Tax=Araneus ventricosus TaxID=182803 RepID=A0A4Y2I8D3_ARAVE|nr:hypothetical protein AVEN_252644-1 [Araneus ventricosus]GBM73628.1 hypothetical protein AVEN_19037-1 [Araneus ventricosus]GBM73632.1 hypothetical protein AVEN_27520-1 [Araneus ventricosus]GBM73662.1 hypothetical protein AVEN_210663-1 [Araneus ventricosus]